jgi:hypothetical protein
VFYKRQELITFASIVHPSVAHRFSFMCCVVCFVVVCFLLCCCCWVFLLPFCFVFVFVFCFVLFFCVFFLLFCFCLFCFSVCLRLMFYVPVPVSLDYPFLIAPYVFSNFFKTNFI